MFHDFRLAGMLHGRVIRPPRWARSSAPWMKLGRGPSGVRVVRVKDFLGVVAADEWDAVCAARALKATRGYAGNARRR